jgi:hypothetical protein
MGHYLKNPVSKSTAINMPTGSSADRPIHPLDGAMRYNTSTNRLEIYDDTTWHTNAKEDPVSVVKNTFAGDNSTVNFTMSEVYTAGQEAQVMVYVNTVWQNPGINYTFNGSTNIHFTSAPGAAAVIVVLHNYATTKTTW